MPRAAAAVPAKGQPMAWYEYTVRLSLSLTPQLAWPAWTAYVDYYYGVRATEVRPDRAAYTAAPRSSCFDWACAAATRCRRSRCCLWAFRPTGWAVPPQTARWWSAGTPAACSPGWFYRL